MELPLISKIVSTPYKYSLLFLSILLFSYPSEARWSNDSEADIIYDDYEEDITIYKNDRTEVIRSLKVTARNEKGRERIGTNRLTYNSNIENVELIEASAIFEGKKYTVPKKMIEKKPLASLGGGFDQLSQFLIAFPKVGVGTQIHLKYKVINKKSALPNYYADTFHFGEAGLWNKATIRIKSELPLQKLVNDPRQSLSVTESKDKKFQKLTISLIKPLYESVSNEMTLIPDNLTTWVKVSTIKTIEDIGNALADPFETALHKPLPPIFKAIKEEAAKETNPIDQMNKVSSLLAQTIRYMGDWRTIQGKLAPHSLKEIGKNGIGDCKDFSVSMGAILINLGFDAQVTLVHRGEGYLPSTNFLPSLRLYNHAMLKVTAKDGKVFWIDPTNMVSMAGGIFSDISDRPCLVLSRKDSEAERIPSIDPKHSIYGIDKKFTLRGENGLLTEGTLTLKGEQAVILTGAALINSVQEIEEGMLMSLSKDNNITNKKIVLPDLTSRIVTDITIPYQYEQTDCVLTTNSGPGIPLDSLWCKPYLVVTPDQVGTLFVGTPAQMSRTIRIVQKQIKDIGKLDFKLTTPWLEVSRKCVAENNSVVVKESITILKSFISAEEVVSPQYKELQKILKTFCTNIAVILN